MTDELKNKLSDEQYYVTQQKGTEAPFSGELVDNKLKGTYLCVCCESELFGSETKFDSGTGWPSFWQAVNDEAVRDIVDASHGMSRIESVCAKCGAHLGHMFPDGPEPTGLRFCINSASLKFSEKDE